MAVRLPKLTEVRGPHLVGFKTPGNSYAVATVSTIESPDRLVHDSVILELNIDSYRLERAKQASQDEKDTK